MHAKVLSFVVYKSHWEWRHEDISLPTWEQIEAAIRRLDKFHYPFIYLWPTLHDSEHECTEGREWFCVVGGKGEYWFAATIGDRWENHYLNPAAGDQEVDLWTSDQGFAARDRHVCRDPDIVLRATRYYAEHGVYDPSVCWSGDQA